MLLYRIFLFMSRGFSFFTAKAVDNLKSGFFTEKKFFHIPFLFYKKGLLFCRILCYYIHVVYFTILY